MLITAHGKMLRDGQSYQAQVSQSAYLDRKYRAYQSLNEAVHQSRGVVSDAVIGCIIMAIVSESRLSKAEATNAHLLFSYETAVRLRGGLRSIILASPTKVFS